MRKIVLDSNIFVLYLVGQINKNQIDNYTRNSFWDTRDFDFFVDLLEAEESEIITSPNVLTEADNILNTISGEDKYRYLELVRNIYDKSVEIYMESRNVSKEMFFDALGLADSVVLKIAQKSDLLISGDSRLCDCAKSLGVKVFDFKEYKNKRL
jgi:predicted nucleic acid-binding protein